MDLAGFLVQYPEFATADSGVIGASLAAAVSAFDPSVCGAYYDQMVGLQCAHLLAMSPNGTFARLASDPTKSTYSVELARYRRICATGLRVF